MAYATSRGEDQEAYAWLVSQSDRMQREMGSLAVVYNFKPPFANYMYKTYPLIVNSIPQLARDARTETYSFDNFGETAHLVRDALLRYEGELDTSSENARTRAKNPLVWFRQGTRLVLVLPLLLARELGVSAIPTAARLVVNPVVSVAGTIVSLATFAAAIVTIIVGWEKTRTFIEALLQ